MKRDECVQCSPMTLQLPSRKASPTHCMVFMDNRNDLENINGSMYNNRTLIIMMRLMITMTRNDNDDQYDNDAGRTDYNLASGQGLDYDNNNDNDDDTH